MNKYLIINKLSHLIDFSERFDCKEFGFDTEFTSLSWYDQKLIGLSIYSDNSSFPATFVQFNFDYDFFVKEKDPKGGRKKVDVWRTYRKTDAIDIQEALPYLHKIFDGAKCICANAKVEWKIFSKYGITNWEIVDDVNLMSWMLNTDTPNDLKSNARKELGLTMTSYTDTIGQKPDNIDFRIVDWEEYGRYGALDAYATYKLRDVFKPQIAQFPALEGCYRKLELPLIKEVARSEMAGVSIDVDYLNQLTKEIDVEIEKTAERIYEEVGIEFNIASSDQLGHVLFDRMNCPVIKTSEKTNKRSVDEDTLKELAFTGYDIADSILDYRKLVKLKSTYTEAIPKKVDADGRLRGSFNQSGTATGRFSSSSPNLQNMPNDKKFPVKRAFVPKPGYKFLCFDWSTIEIRIMAHESGDPVLTKLLQEGRDIHQETCDSINSQFGLTLDRGQGKCVLPQTLIKTESGFVDIGDCNDGSEEDTFYQSKYKMVYADGKMVPIKSFYNNGINKGRIIVTRRGILGGSLNHRLVNESGMLVKLVDLQVGDVLKHQNIKGDLNYAPEVFFNPFFTKGGTDSCSITLDNNWGYFLGAFEGDGSYLKTGKTIGFSVGRGGKYEEWADELHQLFKDIGLSNNEQRKPTNSSNSIYLGSSNLALFLEKLGVGKIGIGKTHRVPKQILNGSRELKLAYLSGLIDTDGYIGNTISVTSKDIYLVQDLCVLLNTLGYDYGIQPCYNKKYGRWYYTVHIYSNSILEFSKEHQLKCSWKIESLVKRIIPIKNRVNKGLVKTPNKLNEVVQIIDVESMPLVDIEVDTNEHLYTANCLFGHNTINFAVLYLMQKDSLAYSLNKALKALYHAGEITKQELRQRLVSAETAQKIIDGYFNAYQGFASYVRGMTEAVKAEGWVWTLGGRRRPVPELNQKKGFGFGRRKAINTPIQGGAGDLMKLGIIKLQKMYEKKGYDAVTLLYVHDEYVIECREDQAEELSKDVKALMENIYPKCSVPIKCEGGIYDDWAGLKQGSKKPTDKGEKNQKIIDTFIKYKMIKLLR